MAMPPMMGQNPGQHHLAQRLHRVQEAEYHQLLQNAAKAAAAPSKDLLEQAAEHYRERRFAEAAELYRQAAAIPLLADQAQCSLGVIALAQGDKAAAVQHFQQSLAANPGYANALYYLGELAEKAGDPATALAYQQRALAASPSHAGALAALGRLTPPTAPPPPVAGLAAPQVAGVPLVPPPPSATPAAGAQLGVYEFLSADTSLLSKQTVAALGALSIDRSSSFLAWLGPLLLRLLLWTLAFVGVSIARLSVGGDFDEDLVWIPAGLHLGTFGLRAATTRYTLHNGRLTVARGLVWRRTTQTELWRIQAIDLERGLMDRITGHGRLVFRGLSPATRKIEVRGVARGKQLRQLHQQLVDLVFLLRGNSVVKGIIS